MLILPDAPENTNGLGCAALAAPVSACVPADPDPWIKMIKSPLRSCSAVASEGGRKQFCMRLQSADMPVSKKKSVSPGGSTATRTRSPPRRLIVGISGASGVIYGVRLLQLLQIAGVETHLVISRSAEVTIAHELDMKLRDVKALASVAYSNQDIAAVIASGSFVTDGMIVAPCSIRSLSEIASGVTTGLLTRAADVVLKERRRLVLMVRETPLHLGHLRTMAQVTELGAIVSPPMPAFYARPASLEEMIDHTVGRVLDLYGMEVGAVRRWRDPPAGLD